MESNNQKTNVANWYNQSSEHYICSFGEEYEQHFTEEKNTDGGCAILTNRHCYLQGKYLLKPKKKIESYSIDEKIPLNKIDKCGFTHSFLTILLIFILMIGCVISLLELYLRAQSIDGKYDSLQHCKIVLEMSPLTVYEEKIDEYNQMVNAIKTDITENGANASCVYLLSENKSISDIIEQYEASKITGLRIYIKQKEVDYYRIGNISNYYKGASTYVWLLSEFTDYDESPLIMTEDTYPGENIFYGTYYDVDVDLEHQRHLNKIFSTPEILLNEVEKEFENCYASYLVSYFEDLIPFAVGYRFDATDLENLRLEVAEFEKEILHTLIRGRLVLLLELCICFVCIAFIIIASRFITKLLKTKFFYIVYRTDTLDNKKLYLLLKKGLYREVKSFSSKLITAKNMKENSVPTTEQATSKSSENSTVNSQPDDLRKYAELLRDGVITQEEFEAMKQKILGL